MRLLDLEAASGERDEHKSHSVASQNERTRVLLGVKTVLKHHWTEHRPGLKQTNKPSEDERNRSPKNLKVFLH